MKTKYMKQDQALQILINAANAACQKGVFNLQEAKIVAEAVETFTKPLEQAPQDATSPVDSTLNKKGSK